MRKAISIASHVFIVLCAIMTVAYNIFRFIEEVKRPGKSFVDILLILLFAVYTVLLLRVEFEMFINAGNLAYNVGRAKISHVLLNVLVLICGLFFIFPPVASTIYRLVTSTEIVWGIWLPFALLGDLILYKVFRWLSFLTSVSEEK